MKKDPSIDSNRKILKLLAKVKAVFNSESSSFKSRILVYLVFVVLAFVLWLYRALDDTFVASISYPVQYKNLPKNKILLSVPPERVSLRVRGNGYIILSNKLKVKKPLDFNVNSFLLHSQTYDSMSVYILTRYAREELSEELNTNADLEIISIAPDSIFFSFARTKAKNIAIKPSVIHSDILLAKQHIINGSIISKPDSMEVVGPSAIIDTLSFIYTTDIAPTYLSDTFSKKVDITPIAQVKMPYNKVTVSIPVDRFTEFSYELPITTKHVPDSINMKLFPRTVRLNFNIAHSQINKVSEADFSPFVDYNDIIGIKDNSTKRLRIKIDSTPSYVHSVRLYPSGVEYINELNNASSRDNGRNR